MSGKVTGDRGKKLGMSSCVSSTRMRVVHLMLLAAAATAHPCMDVYCQVSGWSNLGALVLLRCATGYCYYCSNHALCDVGGWASARH